MTCTIREIQDRHDLTRLSELAEQIWWATYEAILSQEQIRFMLANIYSVAALEEAVASGQRFFMAYENESLIGFIALKIKDANILRIEKLYLLPTVQGKGYGRVLLDFAEAQATVQNLAALELNVNRGNGAYRFYLHYGFAIVDTVDIPYHGFVLDDYVMLKNL